MSYKFIILGSGAAPGVPSLSSGWLDCDPNNPKNYRTRSSAYLEYDNVKILIDTSPDIRQQLISNNIRYLDAVLYTHNHDDHLAGIDYLREINRISCQDLDVYASPHTSNDIKWRYPYMVADNQEERSYLLAPSLNVHSFEKGESFYIKDLKVTPIETKGHCKESFGFSFNDGEVIYICDFSSIDEADLSSIRQQPELLIIPLTCPEPSHSKHAGLDKVLHYIHKIGAKRTIVNHMAGECDYEKTKNLLPEGVEPAYDNMVLEF